MTGFLYGKIFVILKYFMQFNPNIFEITTKRHLRYNIYSVGHCIQLKASESN